MRSSSPSAAQADAAKAMRNAARKNAFVIIAPPFYLNWMVATDGKWSLGYSFVPGRGAQTVR